MGGSEPRGSTNARTTPGDPGRRRRTTPANATLAAEDRPPTSVKFGRRMQRICLCLRNFCSADHKTPIPPIPDKRRTLWLRQERQKTPGGRGSRSSLQWSRSRGKNINARSSETAAAVQCLVHSLTVFVAFSTCANTNNDTNSCFYSFVVVTAFSRRKVTLVSS